MKKLLQRVFGAASLDGRVYEEVERDRGSWKGAVLVAVVASLAAVVGTGVRDVVGVVGGTAVLLATWVVWVILTYIIGTRLLPETGTRADFGEMFRTTGFSASPGLLRILALVPSISLPLYFAITFWMLLAFVVAVKHALDYTSLARAFAVCLLGWIIYGALFFGFVYVAL